MREDLKDLVEQFKKCKVLVIGDSILDTYIHGVTDRLSREAPVPIINVQDMVHECGGSANTAINVASLGAETYFLSVIGRDNNGRELMEVLKKNKVNTEYVIRDKNRTTLAKKRVKAFSNILLRLDDGDTGDVNEEIQKELIEKVKKLYKIVDAIILSDYGYGVITDSLITAIKKLREKQPKILTVDSKNLKKFKSLNATIVKPNYEETIHLLNIEKLRGADRIKQVIEYSKKILEITGAENIAATLDMDGTVLLRKGKKPFVLSSIPQDNKNAIGAGDTFVSAITLAFCANASPEACAEVASSAAAIVLGKEGTAVCTSNELKAYFNDNPKYILNLHDFAKKLDEHRKVGKRVVFTNGCFDILHKGHVSLLNQAKSFGDILIVGINSDASIRRLKGKERPINCLDDRITVLAGLGSVDHLISFEEDSPEKLIKALKPDVFVKGGDYTPELLPEATLVQQLGGEVKIIQFVKDRSTTQIIKRIRQTVKTNRVKEEGIDYATAAGME